MTILYCTADKIGEESGGGKVTFHELEALKEFTAASLNSTRDISYTPLMVLGRDQLTSGGEEPWKWDECAYQKIAGNRTIKLAHFYSGTFGKTIAELKRNGCKVTYTIAAHDRFASRKEHESLGFSFPYPHLTQEPIWQRYIEGYRLSDVIITPGKVPMKTIRNYGPEFEKKAIRIIPHGCDIPEELHISPASFVLGYMGVLGADKGVHYLLDAWKRLDYKDGSMFILAGKDVKGPAGKYYLQRFGGGCIHLLGWVEEIADFYNSISCYVQPSCSEGFGCEVLEAMAHGRPVLCSKAAGAVDLIPEGCTFPPCDVLALMKKIQQMKEYLQAPPPDLDKSWQQVAVPFTWDKIRAKYQEVWREAVSG